ncbi:MAG: sugar phosphate isomerase/epimerase [Bacteroidia bacterium]|nr:sugar phosphate isomerase/epimerase [Bacteroidia bacterium]
MKASRREFIKKSLLATAGISYTLDSASSVYDITNVSNPHFATYQSKSNDAFKISIFSKHLQWLDYGEMAKVAASLGFDGVDLTVRPNGHVLPERVTEDLPKAVAAIRGAGMNVYMITTAIKSAEDPFTENILKTASSLDIRHYRMGYLFYDEKINIEENLKNFKDQLSKLALLNEKYSIQGEYQNHSGMYFGASIWDLYSVLKQINSPWIGSQYDINHATVEGASSWPIGFKLLKSHIKSIDIKDFFWTKKNSQWQVEYAPLGEGMVNFKEYFRLLKHYEINVPISVHYEYALGGAEHGASTLTISKEAVMSSMKKDLIRLKNFLAEEKLIDQTK